LSITLSETLGHGLLFVESGIFFLGALLALWEWRKPKGAFHTRWYWPLRIGSWTALGVFALVAGIFVA